ncbi:hypothetical protein JOB18_033540, partial [Solea senegalensis]
PSGRRRSLFRLNRPRRRRNVSKTPGGSTSSNANDGTKRPVRGSKGPVGGAAGCDCAAADEFWR